MSSASEVVSSSASSGTATSTVAALTVLCVDDRNLVRECVVAVIEQEPGLRVVAEARTVKAAVEQYLDVKPDVTLVSLQLRGLDSLQAIRAIRRADPAARVIVYARDEGEAVYFALDAGATGYLLEDATAGDLVRVITDVQDHSEELLDDIKSKLEARSGLQTLTCREVDILKLLGQGLRTKGIAETLGISDHTVKVHMKNLYRKLGVQGRTAAVAEALRLGFVRLATTRHGSTASVAATGETASL